MKIIAIFLIISSSLTSWSKVKPIRVYIAEISPWLEIKGKSCSSGVICNILNSLKVESGNIINYEVSSLARVNEFFFNGKQDLALFPVTSKLKSKYHNIGKVFSYSVGLYGSSKLNKKSKVCTTRNSPHDYGHDYVYVDTLKKCLKLYQRKRVEGILSSDIEFKQLLSQEEFKSFQVIDELSLYLYLNKRFDKSSIEYKSIQKAYKKLY